MRHTIEVQFEKEYVGNASSFVAFVRAVQGRGFHRNLIGRHFNTLVDKDDYAKEDRDTLLLWMASLPPKIPFV